MMKNVAVFLCALAVCVIAAQADGLPPTLSQIQQQTFGFYSVVGGAKTGEVTSTVYVAAGGGLLYSYQITNLTKDFSWFSIGVPTGAEITSHDFDAGGVVPDLWNILPSSVEASFFSNPVGPGETSALLWFASPSNPIQSIGAMSGYSSSSGFTFAQGTVFAPIPEPMTAILLGAGWLTLRSWRRKS